MPFIQRRLGRRAEIIVTGVSFGAYHAANFALRHADLFPLAICQSGVYDVSVVGWGERGDAVYFNNPADYVQHLGGDHLDWLRGAGQPAPDRAARGSGRTRRARSRARSASPGLLGEKGIRHELDLWGHDVAARLARVARPDRASSPPLPMSDRKHLIGLLLGTEEDWPRAFEHLLAPDRPDRARRRRRTS